MKKLVAFLLTVLFSLSSIQTLAQSNDKSFAASMNAFILRTTERFPEIPGIAVVVIKDDTPVFIRAYGMADKEAGIKAETDTLWYIASSTKSFTALAAQM